MSSEFKVPYTTILDIQPHFNAEKLEVATIYGFQVIVQKDRYKIGDKIIFIPIDSILPVELESKIFPEGSKIKLHKNRIRQIRIRGLASQGMAVDPSTVSDIINMEYISEEQNLSDILGITKYDPPERGSSFGTPPKNRNKKQDNPHFHKYNGLSNIKWFPNFFKDGQQVVVQEKLHGSLCRASVSPYIPRTLFGKLLNFIGLLPKEEKCYGSNNVEISSKLTYKGFYNEDVYGKALKKIEVFSKLKLGETVFFELIGPGIQKNYSYGLKEHALVLFDVKILQEDGSQKWLNPEEVELFAIERGLEHVPILYRGPYNKEYISILTKGPSIYSASQSIREGVVIKSRENYSKDGNKQALKLISEDYLNDPSNSDFH